MTWAAYGPSRAAYGPSRAAYGPQNPSFGGIRWHPLSGEAKNPTRVPAGQALGNPGHAKRPQQDSNLRTRLRSPAVRSSELCILPALTRSLISQAAEVVPRIFRIMKFHP
jgi:hypothetical protein